MPPYINASINDNTIFIYDIKTRIKGIGLGSILMNSLIDYAKDHNIHTINGYITHHDAEKTPWITDYYKKHGFTITPVNDPNMKYLIILDLIDKIG